MVPFNDFKLFALGTAVVIDTALLLMLLDRSNRQRLIVPLALVIAGTWLFHLGALGRALLLESVGFGNWALLFDWLLQWVIAAGLLLMPSAMLHGMLRASITGVDYAAVRDRRYALLYLPLLFLVPLSLQLTLSAAVSPLDLNRWIVPYGLWLICANSFAALGFLRLRAKLSGHSTRHFAYIAGWGLLGLVALHAGLLLLALPLWPHYQTYWQLLAELSPLPLVLLVGYFIVRFNFLQLVLERVLIYGALAAAAVLFHQVFLQDLWDTLSDRYRVNFALVEGIALFALIFLIKPLRQRSSEALRYLLGHSVAITRQQTRTLAQSLSGQSDQSPAAVLKFFCQQGAATLTLEWIAVWLFNPDHSIYTAAGHAERLNDDDVQRLYTSLRVQGMSACRPGSAPTVKLGDALLNAGATAAVMTEHPRIEGLVVFGRGGGDMNQERFNALTMVVEQLALTLDGCQIQAQRRLAERRALQNDKLAALGLVASSIAHEVKNPLSSIKTIASVMREDLSAEPAGTDTQREDLDLIISEIERLTTTVNRLLQFARPAQTHDLPATLQDAADTVMQVMQHLAKQHGVALNTEIDTTLPPLRADAASLREILFNLVGNAIEATGTGGQVSLSAYRKNAKVCIVVEDNGPGIPVELQDTLFTAFVSDKAQGTGLGLYLVDLRVNELGGQIEYTSGSNGTTFTVYLAIAMT